MKQIMTVTGPLAPEEVQGALLHEHVLASAPGIPENYPCLYRKDYYERARGDLFRLREEGINTLVDATAFDLGRDVRTLKRLSEETGIHIIASTGFYQDFSPSFGIYDTDRIAECMIRDLCDGVGDTGIRAGMIKAVMDTEGPTRGREVQHRAAAVASLATGAPVFLHTAADKQHVRQQLAFLQAEGMDLRRVKVDHCLDTEDFSYVQWLYDTGVWLGIERLPEMTAPDAGGIPTERRLRMVKRMIDAGFGDRMLLSHDFSSVSNLCDTKAPEEMAYMEALIPDRWLYIKRHAVPWLIAEGVDPERLQNILYENPRRYFASC